MRSRPRDGCGRARSSWRTALPHARVVVRDLPRLRPSLSADDRRRRAVDARPCALPRASGPRRHVSDDAPLGRRPSARTGRRARAWARCSRAQIYEDERRTLGPPLRFGFAVARHLARHGRDYDVVHTRLVPLLPRARRGGIQASRRATGSSSTGTRCGRARTGGTTQGPSPARSAGCSARMHSRTPARVLHVAHERTTTGGRRFRRRADRPPRASMQGP